MFSSVKNFISRHKRKFIVTGVVVGGTVLAVQYAQRKLREFQEAQAREFIERTRRTQHFENTERTCNGTIKVLAPLVCDELLKNLDTQSVLDQIRENPENKQELWHELKVLSFTRLATLVYACSMLVVALRIQLNILGGYLYKETISGQSQITNHMQNIYLSLNQHFLNYGLQNLTRLIESKVRTILSNYDLKQPLTLAEVENIFWSIQSAVNSDDQDPNSAMGKYMLPQELEDNGGSEQMEKMFAETLDMLEAEDSASINTFNVTRGFTIVMDSIAEFYYEPLKKNGLTTPTTSNHVDIVSNGGIVPVTKADLNVATNINQVKLPLAKLIPIVNGLAGKKYSEATKPTSLSTSLVTLFLISDKVKTLAANVYEVFSQ